MSSEVKAPHTGTGELVRSASNGGQKLLYAIVIIGTICAAAITYVVFSKPKGNPGITDKIEYKKVQPAEPGEEHTELNNNDASSTEKQDGEKSEGADEESPIVASTSGVSLRVSNSQNSSVVNTPRGADAAAHTERPSDIGGDRLVDRQAPDDGLKKQDGAFPKNYSTTTVGSQRSSIRSVTRKRKGTRKTADKLRKKSTVARSSNSKEIIRKTKSKENMELVRVKRKKRNQKDSSDISLTSYRSGRSFRPFRSFSTMSRMTGMSRATSRAQSIRRPPVHMSFGMGPVNFLFKVKRKHGGKPESLGQIISQYKWKMSKMKSLKLPSDLSIKK